MKKGFKKETPCRTVRVAVACYMKWSEGLLRARCIDSGCLVREDCSRVQRRLEAVTLVICRPSAY